MRLLLISNSTNAGEAYLEYPKQEIANFLGDKKKVLFIPYAAVGFSYDEYQAKVQERLKEFDIEVDSIHLHENPKQAVAEAEAIMVGGGNTFHLLQQIQFNDLTELIRYHVLRGTPYVGWSAGSNLACPTIRTTNDMPIVEPDSFNALNLVRFQINPHYLDARPDGHAGETREERLREFMVKNPDLYVVGLREGTMLKVDNAEMHLIGPRPARIFRFDEEAKEIEPGGDLEFLFE